MRFAYAKTTQTFHSELYQKGLQKGAIVEVNQALED